MLNLSTNPETTIVKSWSLLAFAKSFGKMQVGQFINKESGDTFKSCIFTNVNGDRVFVGFSRNLGELSPSEISAQKSDLQVVKLSSGTYSLCKSGSSWQDVEL